MWRSLIHLGFDWDATSLDEFRLQGNIDDYMYTSLSKSSLMSKYFPDNKGGITRSKPITRVKMGSFDNSEDALNLAILFFVHTLMFSQHKEAPISLAHFQIFEDGLYIHFSLGRMSHTLNHSYKNIQPTTEEVRRLDLSFSEDFKTFDSTTAALTSVSVSFAEKMVELVTQISKIPAEVVKALKNEENKQLEDEVGGTITDSIQAAVDTILFGLLTPSTTKSLDVGTSNKMIESQWKLLDSQFSPDFPNAQVREREATKAKAPAKRKRKKSRVLMSPYITKYGSVSKDAGNFDKEEKLKYDFYGYIINQDFSNQLMTDYSQWIAIGLLKTHSAK
ncbi:hypothetical protein FXO38_31348 [Capsicum annuum]|nr:hypothetical protein FXO38_31348 [Capsicum annuum]